MLTIPYGEDLEETKVSGRIYGKVNYVENR